jgi:hypothetical protein
MGLHHLTQKYAQQLENVREMNKVMEVRRQLFSEEVNACSVVYYGDKIKMKKCCDEKSAEIFGEHPPGDAKAPARKQFGINDNPGIFYNWYVKLVMWRNKTT